MLSNNIAFLEFKRTPESDIDHDGNAIARKPKKKMKRTSLAELMAFYIKPFQTWTISIRNSKNRIPLLNILTIRSPSPRLPVT